MYLKVVMIFFIFSVSYSSYGQIQKGSILIGGNGMAYYDSHERVYIDNSLPITGTTRYLGFNINPNISYFILDKLAIGIVSNFELNYEKYIDEFQSSPYSSLTSIGLGPNVRYYIPYKKWAIFPELQYVRTMDFYNKNMINPMTNLFARNQSRDRRDNFQMGIGTAYFLTSNIALEGVFRFNGITNNEPGYLQTSHYRVYTFNVGMQFFLTK